MKKILSVALISALAFASCTSGPNKSKVVGTWQAKSFETPAEDSMAEAEVKMRIQEIDQWTEVPKEFTDQFNIKDLDSAKKTAKDFFQGSFDSREEERQKLIGSFQMILEEDGTCYRKTDGMTDTAVWFLAADASGKEVIVIDPFVPGKLGVAPQATFSVFEVAHISGDSLRVQIRQPEEFKTHISFSKAK